MVSDPTVERDLFTLEKLDARLPLNQAQHEFFSSASNLSEESLIALNEAIERRNSVRRGSVGFSLELPISWISHNLVQPDPTERISTDVNFRASNKKDTLQALLDNLSPCARKCYSLALLDTKSKGDLHIKPNLYKDGMLSDDEDDNKTNIVPSLGVFL